MTTRRILAILHALFSLVAACLVLANIWMYLYGAGPAFAFFACFFGVSAVLNALGAAYLWRNGK